MFRRIRYLARHLVEGLFPPKPPHVVGIYLWSCSMKKAKLRVYWGKSPSSDVVEYSVIVINESTQETVLEQTVSFAETEVVVEVPENTSITETVIANDGVFDSDPVSASYQVGDLTAPAPASFVGIEVLEIVTVKDEEPVEVVEGGELDNLGEETDVVPVVEDVTAPEGDEETTV